MLLAAMDDVNKHQHLSVIIEQLVNVDEGVSEDAQTGQVGEVPCQREACQRCSTYQVNPEEP